MDREGGHWSGASARPQQVGRTSGRRSQAWFLLHMAGYSPSAPLPPPITWQCCLCPGDGRSQETPACLGMDGWPTLPAAWPGTLWAHCCSPGTLAAQHRCQLRSGPAGSWVGWAGPTCCPPCCPPGLPEVPPGLPTGGAAAAQPGVPARAAQVSPPCPCDTLPGWPQGRLCTPSPSL